MVLLDMAESGALDMAESFALDMAESGALDMVHRTLSYRILPTPSPNYILTRM